MLFLLGMVIGTAIFYLGFAFGATSPRATPGASVVVEGVRQAVHATPRFSGKNAKKSPKIQSDKKAWEFEQKNLQDR